MESIEIREDGRVRKRETFEFEIEEWQRQEMQARYPFPSGLQLQEQGGGTMKGFISFTFFFF